MLACGESFAVPCKAQSRVRTFICSRSCSSASYSTCVLRWKQTARSYRFSRAPRLPLEGKANYLSSGPLNCSSTSTWYPVTSLFVSLAIPITACSSWNIASVIPFLRAPAVCEAMQ